MKIRASRQHYSCIQCGRCCRRHNVVVFPEELEGLNRLEIPGVEHPYTEHMGGFDLLRNHSDFSKGCIFLAEDQTCLIHRQYGFARKLLSCRAYPLSIYSTFPGEVGVMACFSCPGVMQETGRLLEDQRPLLENLLASMGDPGPGFSEQQCCGLKKETVLEIAGALQQILSRQEPDFRETLTAAHYLLQKLSGLGAGLLNDGELRREVLSGLMEPGKLSRKTGPAARPGAFQRMLFRSWLLAFIRREGESCDRGLQFRLQQFRSTAGFVLGRGNWHALGAEHPDFSFEKAGLFAGGGGPWSPEIWSSCRRYLLARLEALHFFGPAYYGVSFYDGLAALLESVLAVGACARYHAAARNSGQISSGDVEYGVSAVDFCFGRSPFLGMRMHRNTEKMLSGENFSRFLFCL